MNLIIISSSTSDSIKKYLKKKCIENKRNYQTTKLKVIK